MLEEDLGQPCTYGRLHRHLSFQDRVALSSLWPTERTQSDFELTALLTALQKKTAFLKMTDATAPKCSALKNIRWVAAQLVTPDPYAARERRGWTLHTSLLGPLGGWHPSGVWPLQISEEACDYHLIFWSLLQRMDRWLGQRHGLFCVHLGMTDSLSFFPVDDKVEAHLQHRPACWVAAECI